MLKGSVCPCGRPFMPAGPRQVYCNACSRERHDLRVTKHSNATGNGHIKRGERSHRSVVITQRGLEISRARAVIDIERPINLIWHVTFTVPFQWAGSKNHLWALRKGGHVAMRKEARAYRKLFADETRLATRGVSVVSHKLWIDLLIQKPNHRGDAANFVDLICDGIKDALAIDDRWYALRRLDWDVVKDSPVIAVGLGQESNIPSQICSSCGQCVPFDQFQKNRANKSGHTRNCKSCTNKKVVSHEYPTSAGNGDLANSCDADLA